MIEIYAIQSEVDAIQSEVDAVEAKATANEAVIMESFETKAEKIKLKVSTLPEGYPYIKPPVELVYVDDTFEGFADEDGIGVYKGETTASPFEKGKEYPVTWDGTVYMCIAFEVFGQMMLGNGALYDEYWYSDSGEPFLINITDGGMIFIWASDNISISHTVKIAETIVEVVKMDEKYLPKLVGKDVSGQEFTLSDGTTIIASDGAEVFNSYARNIASGNYSHAEGYLTTASGYASHTEGYLTTASGYVSHAEGVDTTASGENSHAEGYYTTASGDYSHTEGYWTTASGYASHAESENTTASGYVSHAEGEHTTASGYASHAEGYYTTASGDVSHAEGGSTEASGERSHAEGASTEASGDYSHAEGYWTTASGDYSHAEGEHTTASGDVSHAEGYWTTASGERSHAEGFETTASGEISHAEGERAIANGEISHAEGYFTIASGEYQHVQGQFNVEDTENKYAHIVGNGAHSGARSNAHTLDWDGNAWFAGDVYVGSTSGTNKDEGSKKLVTEADLKITSDIPMHLSINADGGLVITYDDGSKV